MLASEATFIRTAVRTPENCAVTVLVATSVALIGALVFDVVFGIEPCSLCLSQRLFFLLAGLTSGIALIHRPNLIVYPIVAALSLLGGLMVSLQHNWILWGPGDASNCGPEVLYLIDFGYPLVDVAKSLLVGSVSCGEPSHMPFAAAATLCYFALLYVVLAQLKTSLKSR